jgi:hypothetical protein
MAQELSDITGIPLRALQGSPLDGFSLTERISWAQQRQATRAQDLAYSLMGLFDVHMSIIYGEGLASARRRLQDEIRKRLSYQVSSKAGIRLLVIRSSPRRWETVPFEEDLQYAILSHTWGSDEVSFDDMRTALFGQRRAFSKIRKCCDLAAEHGFDYLWVDTCCINKSSSAEL